MEILVVAGSDVFPVEGHAGELAFATADGDFRRDRRGLGDPHVMPDAILAAPEGFRLAEQFMVPVRRATGDETETVNADLDCLLGNIFVALLLTAFDQVDLTTERVKSGTLALVQEHCQVGWLRVLHSKLGQCRELGAAPSVLLVGDGKAFAHGYSSLVEVSIWNIFGAISLVNALSTNPLVVRSVTVWARPGLNSTPGGSSPSWSAIMFFR